jgi:hypothetical protein
MSNICAGIGRGQMEVWIVIFFKKKMHDFYVDIFKDIEGVIFRSQ